MISTVFQKKVPTLIQPKSNGNLNMRTNFCKKLGLIINVSNKSIEETASVVMESLDIDTSNL